MEKKVEQQKYIVLLTAAVILCLCRYVLPLLPDSEFVLMMKTWLQEPKRYRLDFAALITLLISTVWMFRQKEENPAILYWIEFFSFAAALPALQYGIEFCEWIQAGGLESPQEVWQDIKIFLANLLLPLVVIFVAAAAIGILKYRKKIWSFFDRIAKQIKKDAFLAEMILFLAMVHVVRIRYSFRKLGGFAEDSQNTAVHEMDSVFMVVFMLAFLMIVVRCIKKKHSITPADWLGIFLCLLGIPPVCEAFRRIIEAVFGHIEVLAGIIIVAACIGCFSVFLYRLDKTGERNKELMELLKEHTYELAENMIYFLFAPFRLVLSYVNILFEAVMDEDKEEAVRAEGSLVHKKRSITAVQKEYVPKVKKVHISRHSRKTRGSNNIKRKGTLTEIFSPYLSRGALQVSYPQHGAKDEKGN